VLLLWSPRPTVAADELYRFRPGLHLSRSFALSKKEQQLLLQGLRECSGLTALNFEENGKLTLGDIQQFSGGSASARTLLQAVADSRDSFTLESTPNSAAIAFAQIEATADYVDAEGRKQQAWHIRIDFSDFSKLRGSETVLDAFSPTMNLLHELAHGELKLRDPVDDFDLLGDCENYINRIRAELNLPLREFYLPFRRQPFASEIARTEQAELSFRQFDSQARSKTLYLSFGLTEVCATCKTQGSSSGFSETWTASIRLR
jgi:hypothetical protein